MRNDPLRFADTPTVYWRSCSEPKVGMYTFMKRIREGLSCEKAIKPRDTSVEYNGVTYSGISDMCRCHNINLDWYYRYSKKYDNTTELMDFLIERCRKTAKNSKYVNFLNIRMPSTELYLNL